MINVGIIRYPGSNCDLETFRYFNFNDELKWGGILAKKYNFNDINMMCLLNSFYKKNTISFEKNYVFYKKHTTQADKTRKLFLSYLDKYKE